MPTKLQLFEEIIASGDGHALCKFMTGTNEIERSAYAPKAIAWYKKTRKMHTVQPQPNVYGFEFDYPENVRNVSTTAVLVTASGEQLAKLTWHIWEGSFDLSLVKELRPLSLERFGDVLVNSAGRNFDLVRTMMECGLCRKPESENYIVGFSLQARHSFYGRTGHPTLKSWLQDNPDLLEEDVWRLFEVEGDQLNSLRQIDESVSPTHRWRDALIQLSEEEVLSRERLLSASLDALSRGFNQYRSAWYSQFHESLVPTIGERIRLEQRYALLLGSNTPTTVTFALKALKEIESQGGLSEDVMRKALPLVLSAKAKSTIGAAIAFLENAIRKNANFAEDAAMICMEGLQHESVDLQKQVISFLVRYGNRDCEKFQKKLALYADGVSPLLAGQLRELSTFSVTTLAEEHERESYVFDSRSSDGWPLRHAIAVAPIVSAEEFVAKALYCLEHPEDALEIERVLQAVSALNLRANPEFMKLSAPIESRAKKLRQNVEWRYLARGLFADFLFQWLHFEPRKEIVLLRPANSHAVIKLMSRRMLEILERVKFGIHLPLLSSPCFSGGWIDAKTFDERKQLWADAGEMADEYDQMLALFRMPTAERSRNHKFGVVGEQLKAGLQKWEAISREPDVSDRRQPMTVSLYRDLHELEMAVDIGDGCLFSHMPNYAIARWSTSMFPSMRESLLSLGVNWGVTLLDDVSASDRGIRAFFELITEPGAPLARKAYVMMLVGFLMKDPEFAAFSRDAVIQAIDERRLDPVQMGKRIAQFLHSDRAKPKRLVASMREVSRVSSLHSDAILQLICSSFHGDSWDLHREASVVFEFLLELLTASGGRLEDGDAREYLQTVKTGGKTGKVIKQLLGDS